MPDTEGELAYLSVSCDKLPFCDATLSADFKVRIVDDRPTRLGYVLDYATRKGWHVEGRQDPLTAMTFCPVHALKVSCADTSEVTATVVSKDWSPAPGLTAENYPVEGPGLDDWVG